MPTALTVYPTSTNDGTLTTARLLTTAAPNAEATVTQKTGKSVNWGEMQSQGNTSAWAASATEISPTGHGWIWNGNPAGNDLLAGTWTFKVKLGAASSGSQTSCIIACRAYKRSSGGVYTLIVDAQLTGQTISTATIYTVTGTGVIMSFGTGDRLYVDTLVKIGSNSSASTTATTGTSMNLSTNESVVTPGYQASVTGTGAIAEAYTLASTGAETFSGTGAVAKGYTLAASGTVTAGAITGTGAIHEAYRLSATGAETFTGTAGIKQTYKTAVTAAQTFSGTGGVKATYKTAATGAETFSATGGVKQKYALAGSQAVTVTGTGAIHAGFTLAGTGTQSVAADPSLGGGRISPRIIRRQQTAAGLAIALVADHSHSEAAIAAGIAAT